VARVGPTDLISPATSKKRRRIVYTKPEPVKPEPEERPEQKEAGDGPCWVLVSNLRRPFTLGMLRTMLQEVGRWFHTEHAAFMSK
jgi:hypothetical protein